MSSPGVKVCVPNDTWSYQPESAGELGGLAADQLLEALAAGLADILIQLMQLRGRAPTTPIDDMAETIQPSDLPHNLHAWPIDPADAALSEELRAQLEAALAELPERLRVVFVLRELQGLSTAETAAALGLQENAVKVRLHRARLRLRELLTDYLTMREG